LHERETVLKPTLRLCAAAFAGLLFAGIAGSIARADGPFDGVYSGTTDSPDRRCNSSKFSMTVKDNLVTKWGGHGMSGSVASDGSLTVHSSTFAGGTATTTGKISGGVFTGETVEQGGFNCIWQLKLTSQP
jgi:hypothetical protein